MISQFEQHIHFILTAILENGLKERDKILNSLNQLILISRNINWRSYARLSTGIFTSGDFAHYLTRFLMQAEDLFKQLNYEQKISSSSSSFHISEVKG